MLPLAGDGQGGDDHHPDGGDHGDQRRHHKPFVVQIRVVPVTHHQLAVVGLRFAVHQLLLIILHHLLQIVGRNLGAVRVAPVEDKLHRRGLEGIQVTGKICREAHQQQGFLRIDGRLDFLRAFQQQDMGKRFCTGKALRQLDGMFTVVFVVNGDGGVGHLKRRGKGEQQNLDQHRQNQNGAGLRLAQQGLQLFSY